MTTSFGALCTDFLVNHKLTLKMDLPSERETVMHLLDRVRAEIPAMSRFKRYRDELALETPRREGKQMWLALRRESIRSGALNPESLAEAYHLHRLILEISPYFMTISPLDIESLELSFGFELECKANHNLVVREALLARSPLNDLLDLPGAVPIDVQPIVGMALDEHCHTHAYVEIKTRSTLGQIRANRYRNDPISVFLTVRYTGPINHVDELGSYFDRLAGHCERLTNERLAPKLLQPLSRAILGSV